MNEPICIGGCIAIRSSRDGESSKLLPDIRFDLRHIWVSGGAWNTIVVIEWDEANSGTWRYE